MSVNFNALYLDSRAFVFAKREIMLSSLYFYFARRSVLSPLGLCTYVYSTYGGQKRELDPLRLELQATVSFHVGAGN